MTASRSIVLAVAVSAVILDAGRAIAVDNGHGAELAAMCASCHRLDGRDIGIPSIVGIDKKQFADAMAAFKSGARSSSIMHAVALQFSDAEIATLAQYLAAQPKGSKLQ
jgi:sulfide dehydrogenase cytochrome subunit